MNAMLTEFTLANFKSYSTSDTLSLSKGRLPLGSLTVLIGANAAGKSNALEGLRFLSWLAQGQKLSSIQYAVNSAERVVRGRVNDFLFLDPVPARMREYSFKSDKRLQEDGTNLSSVLYRLWENQAENQQAILNFIQSLPEQAIDGLDFLFGPRDEVMVQLAETFGNTRRYCEAALLSDGTLRVLAIAAAMLS